MIVADRALVMTALMSDGMSDGTMTAVEGKQSLSITLWDAKEVAWSVLSVM